MAEDAGEYLRSIESGSRRKGRDTASWHDLPTITIEIGSKIQ